MITFNGKRPLVLADGRYRQTTEEVPVWVCSSTTYIVCLCNQLKKTQLKQADWSHIKCQQTVIFQAWILEFPPLSTHPFSSRANNVHQFCHPKSRLEQQQNSTFVHIVMSNCMQPITNTISTEFTQISVKCILNYIASSGSGSLANHGG